MTYHGRHYRPDDPFISPRPAQQPGPPIWIGAKVATDADSDDSSFDASLPKLVVGSQAEYVEHVGARAEMDVNTLVIRLQYAEINDAQTMRRLERLAADVMPVFAGGQ